MFNTTPWKKAWRDVTLNKSRSFLIVISIAVSTFTLAVIFNTYAILSQAMEHSYLQANPTAISFQVESFDDKLIERVRLNPAVNQVDGRRILSGQIKTQQGDWLPMLLFVLRDYEDIKLDVVTPEKGQWPPQDGQVLIERQALSVLGGQINDQVSVDTGSGPIDLRVGGTVHDVVLAQAEWENVVYGYINKTTLEAMGKTYYLNRLNLNLKDFNLSQQQMQPVAAAIKQWLTEQKYQVPGFQVAKPGKHAHANVTDGMFMIQKVFALVCCLLSGVLVFNLISAALARQVPQIGLMKAVGANSSHIRYIYFSGVLVLGILAMLLSVFLAYFISVKYVNVLAGMMNIDIHSYAIPWWVLGFQIAIGLLVPLLSAAVPIIRASFMTVRETFIVYGLNQSSLKPNRVEQFLFKLNVFSLPVRFALRNALRNKGRFVLTTVVLALGGALFMSTFHVSASMKQAVEDERMAKNWDVVISFKQPSSVTEINQVYANAIGVKQLETYRQTKGVMDIGDSEEKVSLGIVELQPESEMVAHQIIDGQWLSGKTNEMVISQMVLSQMPGLEVGMTVRLKVYGDDHQYTVVGVARILGLPMAYVSQAPFFSTPKWKNKASGAYLVTAQHDAGYLTALSRQLRTISTDLTLNHMITSWQGLQVISDHFEIIFSLMMLLTMIVVLIACSGIVLSVSSNVLERTREIGVLKAIGASNKILYKMLFSECVFTAVLGWVVACLLAVPLSYLVAAALGNQLIQTPLNLALDEWAFVISLPLMILIGVASALFPARRMNRFPIRDALVFE